MNIFSEMFYSCAGVKKYPEFIKNKAGKVFLYVMLVVLIYTAIAQVRTIPETGEFITKARETLIEFSDFELKSGKLWMEESFYLEEDGVLVMIESEYGSYIRDYYTSDWYEMLDAYDSVLIMDETTILLKSDGTIDVYDYPEDFVFTKETVYGWLDYIYPIVIVYIVLAYLFSVMGYFFTALLVAIAGMIICTFMKQNLTFGQVYILAIYAKTLPLLIKGIFKLVSLDFFGFSFVMFVVACVYVGCAIHHMDLLDEEKKWVNGPIIF